MKTRVVRYTVLMADMEHREWLENRNARKAAAKKSSSKPPIPSKKSGDKKKGSSGEDEENVRAWVID